jgi:hypothetical protein
MRPQLLVQPEVLALGERVGVQFAQDRRETVGIVDLEDAAARSISAPIFSGAGTKVYQIFQISPSLTASTRASR